jgi:hypothetical protein
MLGFLAEDGRRRRDPEAHPSAETLTAYQANELAADEDERIQSHLAVCAQCTELLLDLDEFLQPPMAAAPVADFEAAADWRKLRESLGAPEKKDPAARPDRRRFFASVWGGYSVAAALLAMVVGLGIWNAKLAEELLKPQPIFTVQTLEAQGSSRGATSPSEPVTLPAEITLLLPTDAPDSRYRIDITRDGSHRPEWSFDVSQNKNSLSFRLAERSLSSGVYSVQVVASGQGRPDAAAWSYTLQIVPSAH